MTRETPQFTEQQEEREERRELNISNIELMLLRLLVDSDMETKEYLMDNLEVDFISDKDAEKIINYIFKNIDNPDKITHVHLFNEFNAKRIREIIGKALLDENYIMQENKDKNHMKEAKFVLSQMKIANIRKQILEIENKIKSVNEYSPETLKLQKKHQDLTKERVALEKEMKSK